MLKMRLKTYIVSILLLMLPLVKAAACGPYWWSPADYMMPRIFDPDEPSRGAAESDALFRDWLALTGRKDIRIDDIKAVVNDWSVGEVWRIAGATALSNSFARWLGTENRTDVLDYLVLAKECEQIRGKSNSRWYYPSKGDEVTLTLEDIRDRCVSKAAEGGQLAPRYALQALRAMNSLKDFRTMLTFWNGVSPLIPEGVIRDMCAGYAARSEFEFGDRSRALKFYASNGDFSSLEFCLKRMGKRSSGKDVLELVARYSPDARYAAEKIQQWFSDNVMYDHGRENWAERMTEQRISREDADMMCRLCDIALSSGRCRKNPAMWLYCKALALDFNGRCREAVPVGRQARAASGTEFIKNSIRVLNIYLDAKTSAYDSAYEARLLRDLRWMDRMIEDNLTDEIRRKTQEEPWYLIDNASYYYWNDMLKKILLGEVCPRMLAGGKGVLAIRLANMADNRFVGLCEGASAHKKRKTSVQPWDYGYPGSSFFPRLRESDYKMFNIRDYCNGLFHLINQDVRISDILKYADSVGKAAGALDGFLDARGYTNQAYFLDVAGTRLIRERKYSRAVKVLEQVPAAYQNCLNTVSFMDRNPFETALNAERCIYPDYKLNFAKRMAEYERIVRGDYGPDEKGVAKIYLGVGTESAVTFAWTLTHYLKNWYESDEERPEHVRKSIRLGNLMIREGLEMIEDKETKAQMLLFLDRRLEVVQNYRETMAASWILCCCDEYKDYR